MRETRGDILFAWAHLSDTCFGAEDAAGRKLVLAELRGDLATSQVRGCPALDAILVTGDVAWSGASEQYAEASAWLGEVAQAAGVAQECIYAVPGNHDVLRAAGDRGVRRLVDALRAGREPLDESLKQDREQLEQRFAGYLRFASGLAPPCKELFWVHRFEKRGLRVCLVGLNTAFLAADDVDMGKLRLGKEQLCAALAKKRDEELIVVLSHHPFRGGWLADEVNADRWIRNHAHLHLFGHMKGHESEEARSGAAGSFVRIAAGAVHQTDGDHGYSIAAIIRAEDRSIAVRIWPRRWSDKNKDFRDDLDAAPDDRRYAEHKLHLAVELSSPRSVISAARYEGPGGVPILPVPHFMGRDDELRDLRTALITDNAICVVATGLGGIGKTSLVRQFVATEAPAMFPDGSVWIDAMSLDADAARAAERFGYDGDRRPAVAEAARFLVSALYEKRVLVVIDNVDPDRVDVSTLPIAGGKSRTVLTSRAVGLHEALGKPARMLSLGRWAGDVCRVYLREVVPSLSISSDEELDALAAFVGRLPLAVRLLARLLLRVGATPIRLLEKLKKEPLGTLDKVATGADRGVAATFNASYEGLDDHQRRGLLALAACARVTSEGVVARVTGLGEDEAAELLADLAERSLIDLVDGAARRWTLHDVVRLFAREQEGMRHVDAAHLAFAEQHLEAHQAPADWLALETGMDEVLTAVDRLLERGETSSAARLMGRAVPHLVRRGQYPDIVARCAPLTARLSEGSMELSTMLCSLGRYYGTLDEIPKAIQHLQRALAIAEELGWLDGQSAALSTLGFCHRELRQLPEAQEHHRRALAIEGDLGRREGQARELGNLGLCLRRGRDTWRALEHFERAQVLFEELDNLEGVARQLANRSVCYRRLGEPSKAIELLLRALVIDERLGLFEAQDDDLHNLGNCHGELGDFDRARDCLLRAIELLRRMGFPEAHPRLLHRHRDLARFPAVPS